MFVNQQVDEAERLTCKQKEEELIIRTYSEEDFENIMEMEKRVYPAPWPQDDLWNTEQLQSHLDVFSEGALCVQYENEIIGTMTTFIVEDIPQKHHTWEEITDSGYLTNTHVEDGDTLYVADLQVNPEYRELGIGKKLMYQSYKLVRKLHLRRLVGAVRMPGFHKYKADMTPEQYVEQVVSGRMKDPVISFMLRCGRKPVKVIHNYLEDIRSANHAVLMEWTNPDFN